MDIKHHFIINWIDKKQEQSNFDFFSCISAKNNNQNLNEKMLFFQIQKYFIQKLFLYRLFVVVNSNLYQKGHDDFYLPVYCFL